MMNTISLKIPTLVLVIFFLVEGLCFRAHSKNIILEDEISSLQAIESDRLKVKCDYWKAKKINKVQWTKESDDDTKIDSSNILSKKSQWLHFKNVKHSDRGRYSCFLEGITENGSFFKWRNFTLITYKRSEGVITGKQTKTIGSQSPSYRKDGVKPKFINKLYMDNNIALQVNDSRTLNCPIKSTYSVTFSWYKNDLLLVEKGSEFNYTLNRVMISDAGNYTCVVKNELGSIKHTFIVDIYEKNQLPVLAEYPQNLTLKLGDTARFVCKTFDPDHIDFEWYFLNYINPQSIKSEDLPLFKKMVTNNTVKVFNDVLILENISTDDSGWYACYLNGTKTRIMTGAKLEMDKNSNTNDQGSGVEGDNENKINNSRKDGYYNKTKSATPPKFTKLENMHKMIAKPAGNILKLKCLAKGNPLPNITWYKNEITPPLRQLGVVKYSQWAIVLKDLIVTDSGNYTCKVCNINGCINFTRKVDIVERFPHKPYIKEGQPRNVTALVYTNVSFECMVISDLEPFMQWYYHNASVANICDENLENGIIQNITAPEGNPEVLQLFNVTHMNEGWYTCVASNSLGISYASAYLKVVDELDEVMKVNVFQLQTFQLVALVVGFAFVITACVIMIVLHVSRREREKNKRIANQRNG